VHRFVDENGAAAGGGTICRNWIESREPRGIGVGRRKESRSWRTGDRGLVRSGTHARRRLGGQKGKVAEGGPG
jgi:hypothetical protein